MHDLFANVPRTCHKMMSAGNLITSTALLNFPASAYTMAYAVFCHLCSLLTTSARIPTQQPTAQIRYLTFSTEITILHRPFCHSLYQLTQRTTRNKGLPGDTNDIFDLKTTLKQDRNPRSKHKQVHLPASFLLSQF